MVRGTWAKAWGEKNDVQVEVDHASYTQLPALAATEVKRQRGHDIFGFLSPPAHYEDQVINHAAIVSQIEAEVGPYGELGMRSTYNPKTKKYVGVSDYFVPGAGHLAARSLERDRRVPATWDHVRAAAPALKALGHPVGIGQGNDLDSNVALLSLLMCFGAFLQDESNTLTIDGKNTVEAVQFMADLHASGGESSVFGWNEASNNQFILSGRGSLIVNAISAIRRAEDLGMPVVPQPWISPVPHGPRERLRRRALHERLLGLEVREEQGRRRAVPRGPGVNSGQATPESKLFNFPSFPAHTR